MTVAAGLPIASLIPGGQKAHSQPGTSAASSAPATAGATVISFRAGLEALVSSAQAASSEAPSSKTISQTIQDQLAEADSIDSPGHAMRAVSQNGSSLASLSGQIPQASLLSGPKQSAGSVSNVSQATRTAKPKPAALPAAVAASPTAPSVTGKQAASEHATQSKQSTTAQRSTKTTTQASTSTSEGLAQPPVHLADLKQVTTPPSQPLQSAHTAVESSSLTPSGAAAPASALLQSGTHKASTGAEFISAGASAESQGKTLTIASATEEAHPSSDATANTLSTAAEAHAAHTASANVQTAAQSAPQRAATPLQSSANDSALERSLKATSAQPASGNVDNSLQPAIGGLQSAADAPQAHASSSPTASPSASHAPAPRERSPLQHELAGDAAQLSPAIGSHSTLVRDSAGITGMSTERSAAAGSSSAQPAQSSSAPLTARDTFAALDADPGQPATTWTHTSPRQVEAGYQDPSLGWVSVRADLTPGGLHAAVVPNSPEAAQALGSHLSGLNAYLAEHHGGSITASLAAPEGQSSSLNHNSQSGTEPGSHQQNQSSDSTGLASTSTSASAALRTDSAQHSEPAVFTPTHNGRISVLA
jgi:hypothetical protein